MSSAVMFASFSTGGWKVVKEHSPSALCEQRMTAKKPSLLATPLNQDVEEIDLDREICLPSPQKPPCWTNRHQAIHHTLQEYAHQSTYVWTA